MFKIVKKHIDKWDPFGLLSTHCPDDKYDSESKNIAKKITEYYSVKDIAIIISKIFSSSFSEKINLDECLNVVQNIYDEIHKV